MARSKRQVRSSAKKSTVSNDLDLMDRIQGVLAPGEEGKEDPIYLVPPDPYVCAAVLRYHYPEWFVNWPPKGSEIDILITNAIPDFE